MAINLMKEFEKNQAEIADLKQQLAQREWISVEDRLPKDEEVVVVHSPGAAFCDLWPCRFDKKNNCFNAGGGWFKQEEVTHWARQPPPPSNNQPPGNS